MACCGQIYLVPGYIMFCVSPALCETYSSASKESFRILGKKVGVARVLVVTSYMASARPEFEKNLTEHPSSDMELDFPKKHFKC